MPKDTGKDCGGVRHMATTQGELKNLATHLIVDSRGVDAREIVSSYCVEGLRTKRPNLPLGDHFCDGGQ